VPDIEAIKKYPCTGSRIHDNVVTIVRRIVRNTNVTAKGSGVEVGISVGTIRFYTQKTPQNVSAVRQCE
jgi:hypothetical protein